MSQTERPDTEPTRIWVCVDCYLTHHGYDEHELGYKPDCEPLSLIPDGARVWSGGEHERMDFSWTPCEGCGSPLGGAREALTID